MNKSIELEKLKQEMVSDTRLPLKTNLVFGEGNADCQVLFIGEAPGALEDELVRPFVGRSGQLLRKCIRELGWKEEDVYITNIVKRRPPENRDPSPKEIEFYKPYLTRQIEIIKPKIIVTLGRFSMSYFLPEAKISRDQGKLRRVETRDEFAPSAGDWYIVPMLHPAYALRGTRAMNIFTKSFKKLPSVIKTVKNEN
ncbi:MAG: uracil-DNA glycosylase [Candidatus Staskawiczbacteria bacterium]|nr:uracil-DNA glycosylase [Candidatus Staskawiczbacteria bacterium]